MIKPKPCKYCGGTDHTTLMCFNKPRVPFKPATATKGYQNMEAAYTHWYRENPPDENDLWYCFYCGVPLTREPSKLDMGVQRITIDHYLARSGNVEIKYDPANFVACCFKCNSEKGSMSGDDYIELRKRRDNKNVLPNKSESATEALLYEENILDVDSGY